MNILAMFVTGILAGYFAGWLADRIANYINRRRSLPPPDSRTGRVYNLKDWYRKSGPPTR